MSIWRAMDQDMELFRRELDGFVPDRIFDSHVHIYNVDYFPQDDIPAGLVDGPRVVDAAVYLAHMAELIPGRSISALVFPFPRARLRMAEANRFAARETAKIPSSRAQMMVAPNDDPEMIRETVRSLGLAGLKCYHLYSPVTPTFDSPIEAFLPEEQVRVAHEEKLSITLHIVKQRSLADPENQRTLRRYAETYPDMRLILAHAGRGFNPHHTAEGIGSLTGLPNVYFDTAAVTDYGAIEAIIQTVGHQAVLYGSDFPVSHTRGREIALGDTFVWLHEGDFPASPYGPAHVAFVGFESLRVHKLAARHLRLTDAQVEDIFYGNAARLYDL